MYEGEKISDGLLAISEVPSNIINSEFNPAIIHYIDIHLEI